MLCHIADLYVSIPKAGDMFPRCREYLIESDAKPDIIIREEDFNRRNWPGLSENGFVYMESGLHFYGHLLKHAGMMLHASALEYQGRAWLFSGHSGVGKSTHTRLWQQCFGPEVQIFNDDKPALRRLDDRWYAYGTPWCGKDGINQNKKVPLGGICFLKQGDENIIRRLTPQEAAIKVISQTMRKFKLSENLDLMLSRVDQLVREIPIFELTNRPEPAAAMLSCETMLRSAEEERL